MRQNSITPTRDTEFLFPEVRKLKNMQPDGKGKEIFRKILKSDERCGKSSRKIRKQKLRPRRCTSIRAPKNNMPEFGKKLRCRSLTEKIPGVRKKKIRTSSL
jgi:hypothetical protein